ncbi:MAG: glycosyltransferase [Cytophagaceae bacterium]
MELISIVMPVYNGEKYLKEAINSILSQSYQEFELIISDDNSKDNSLEVVRSFSDNRIKIISNLNNKKGIFSNLNYAIACSKGKFIQIFCQDDLMMPFFLEKQVTCFNKFPEAGMVFSNKYSVKHNLEIIENSEDKIKKNNLIPEYLGKKEGLKFFLSFGCLPGNLSPVMLRRETIKVIGSFDESFRYVGDFDYWIRTNMKFPIIFQKQPALLIRDHSEKSSKILNLDYIVIQEEIPIYEKILQEAYSGKSRDLAIAYIVNKRGSQYAQWLLRGLLNFKIELFYKGLKMVKPPFSRSRIFMEFLKIRFHKGNLKHYYVE